MMFESYDTEKRRKAVALVLEDKLTPSQVARALCYTARSVRLWVREYLVLHPNGPVPESSYTPTSFEPLSTSPDRRMAQPSDRFSFLPVVLDASTGRSAESTIGGDHPFASVTDAPRCAIPQPSSCEIVTPGGYTIRVFNRSVNEAGELIRSLEETPC
jgi:transposase-like protein